jgi:signal transduction histidine kinase
MPPFTKSIRFRLTLWYSAFLVLMLTGLVIGLNVAMSRLQPPINKAPASIFPGDAQVFQRAIMAEERARNIENLRNYSIIGVGGILVLGISGGYFLSSRMLRPVDRVSTLAGRISHANLKERINYQSSNDEIKRLADTFDGMLSRLENSFESQKQFIQDASHELRTPIAIAQTNIEVLEMNKKATTADYRHTMDVIRMSLDRMTAINDSLLILSQGDPMKSRWFRIDMGNLVKEVVFETQAEANAKNVELNVSLPSELLEVMGDNIHLKQVLINLIDNSIKYNLTGGRVKVTLLKKENNAVIEVQDNGIGISEDDLPHVFNRFYRAEKSRTRNTGGSGLGLAIVKKIVDDHGGTVSMESEAGKGTIARVILPVAE